MNWSVDHRTSRWRTFLANAVSSEFTSLVRSLGVGVHSEEAENIIAYPRRGRHGERRVAAIVLNYLLNPGFSCQLHCVVQCHESELWVYQFFLTSWNSFSVTDTQARKMKNWFTNCWKSFQTRTSWVLSSRSDLSARPKSPPVENCIEKSHVFPILESMLNGWWTL